MDGERFRVLGSGFWVLGSGFWWRLRRLFLEDGILVSQPSPLGEGLYGSGFAASFFSVQDDDTGEQLVACRGIFRQAHKKRASWKRCAFCAAGLLMI